MAQSRPFGSFAAAYASHGDGRVLITHSNVRQEMKKELYVFPELGMNCTISETLNMMRLLNEHGIFAGYAQIELVPSKDATTQENRTVPFERAEQAGFLADEPLYITFQIGRENRTTAGYLARLFKMHGSRAMVQRLYLEHVSSDPAAWDQHLLSLPGVQKALEKAFK